MALNQHFRHCKYVVPKVFQMSFGIIYQNKPEHYTIFIWSVSAYFLLIVNTVVLNRPIKLIFFYIIAMFLK